MEKMPMQTPDIAQENIAVIREKFPHCVTEKRDEKTGRVILAVDFDLLRQSLSSDIVEGPQERYRLDWPGKRASLALANQAINKSLRPKREESVDFDTTQNLFIEGDNLDALKLLRETYLGKVKMIYIDPPYNTGNDFIYSDNYNISKDEYAEVSGQKDEEKNRLIANRESNGRFHSDWLSMLYPRLKLAKDFLRDDGVIFISIDDNEIHNLRKICDEIFGEGNFIGSFVWKRRSGIMDSNNNLSEDHEYVVSYSKCHGALNGVQRTFENYRNPDNDPRGDWVFGDLSAGKAGGNTYYPVVDPQTGRSFLPPKGRYWPYSPQTMKKKIAEGRVIFPEYDDGRPMLKRFATDAVKAVIPVSSWIERDASAKAQSSLSSPMNGQATRLLKDMFGEKLFSFSKPVELVENLLKQGTSKDSIVFDFFAGSGTTAHAVMELNAQDGGDRRFILVQLDEPVDENSESHKAGYKNIAEITKERIRRAGRKIVEEATHKDWKKDIGFRVLKIDSSNMKDIYYRADQINQASLGGFVDNVKEKRTSEDLLFQVMGDFGIDLGAEIEHVPASVNYPSYFSVDNGALLACFRENITEDFAAFLAKQQPERVVFQDSGFSSDAIRINVGQIFKQYAPSTVLRVL